MQFLAARESAGKLRAAALPVLNAGMLSGSFISYLLGITRANPLPPHYYCPRCRRVEFVDEHMDGFDLPPKRCGCGGEMWGDGHNCTPEFLFLDRNRNLQFYFSVERRVYFACRSVAPEARFEIRSPIRRTHSGGSTFSEDMNAWLRNARSWYEEPDPARPELFLCREDVYKYLRHERGYSEEDAFFLADRIRKGRYHEIGGSVFPIGDWRDEFCKNLAYLPSKAMAVEELVLASAAAKTA